MAIPHFEAFLTKGVNSVQLFVFKLFIECAKLQLFL